MGCMITYLPSAVILTRATSAGVPMKAPEAPAVIPGGETGAGRG